MRELLFRKTGSWIGDTAHGAYAQTQVIGGNRLWNGTHADGLAADLLKITNLCGCFISRSADAAIYSARKANFKFVENLDHFIIEFAIISFAHVWKARAELRDVWTLERIIAHEIDVIVNDHKITGFHSWVQAAC